MVQRMGSKPRGKRAYLFEGQRKEKMTDEGAVPQSDSHQNRLCCEENDEKLLGRVKFARAVSTVKFFKLSRKERR